MLRYYSSGKWRIALASNKKENQTIRGFSSYIIPKFSFNSLKFFLYLHLKMKNVLVSVLNISLVHTNIITTRIMT